MSMWKRGLLALAGYSRDALGLGSLALVVAGVWGLWGWQWAAIAAGLPTSAFYLWGEIRSASIPREFSGGSD